METNTSIPTAAEALAAVEKREAEILKTTERYIVQLIQDAIGARATSCCAPLDMKIPEPILWQLREKGYTVETRGLQGVPLTVISWGKKSDSITDLTPDPTIDSTPYPIMPPSSMDEQEEVRFFLIESRESKDSPAKLRIVSGKQSEILKRVQGENGVAGVWRNRILADYATYAECLAEFRETVRGSQHQNQFVDIDAPCWFILRITQSGKEPSLSVIHATRGGAECILNAAYAPFGKEAKSSSATLFGEYPTFEQAARERQRQLDVWRERGER
jgi:hypothetical protein